jgi:hypothetical protein
MNENDPITWQGRDLSSTEARMYYRGVVRMDPIRGSVYLTDLPGSPLLMELLPADEYEIELKVIGGGRTARSALVPAEVLAAGLTAFTTELAVRQWLDEPAQWTGGRTPRELIDEGQIEEVIVAINRIAHGIPQ